MGAMLEYLPGTDRFPADTTEAGLELRHLNSYLSHRGHAAAAKSVGSIPQSSMSVQAGLAITDNWLFFLLLKTF